MDDNNWFAYLVIIIIGIIVNVVIIRAVFSINQFLRYKKAEIKLLALLAEKQGASPGLVKEIVFECNPAFKNDEHFDDEEKG